MAYLILLQTIMYHSRRISKIAVLTLANLKCNPTHLRWGGWDGKARITACKQFSLQICFCINSMSSLAMSAAVMKCNLNGSFEVNSKFYHLLHPIHLLLYHQTTSHSLTKHQLRNPFLLTARPSETNQYLSHTPPWSRTSNSAGSPVKRNEKDAAGT